MLLRLIDDINRALENDCFFSALSLALTLPDICGKAKYPDEKSNKNRYIAWYDEYVGSYEKYPGRDSKVPYLSGEVVYSLRCSFLHQGNPSIEKDKIKDECCKIDNFTLLVEKKKEYNVLLDSASISENYINDRKVGNTQRSYEVNVRRLCFILSACASGYYKEYKEQFCFFDFQIVDLDERYAAIRN